MCLCLTPSIPQLFEGQMVCFCLAPSIPQLFKGQMGKFRKVPYVFGSHLRWDICCNLELRRIFLRRLALQFLCIGEASTLRAFQNLYL